MTSDATSAAPPPAESGLRGMKRNIAYASVSAGSAALLLAVVVLIGRLLGEEAYGRFAFALALATIGEALMDFGLHQATIRAVARDRHSAATLFRNSLALKVGPAILMVVAITVLARILRPDVDTRWASTLLAVSAVMRSYLLTVRGVLQGLEHFGWDSVVVIVDRALLLAASAIALLLGGSIVGVAWGFVIARVLAVAAALALARWRFGSLTPAFDWGVWSDLGRRAIPLGAFLLVLNLYSYIDTVMLGVLSTDAETGLYKAAYSLYEGLTYVPAVLSAVVTPRLARDFVHDRPRHTALARQALIISVALAAVVAAGTWVMGDWTLRLLFGEPFAAASRTLTILAVGLLVVYPIWILHSLAMSVTAERVLLQTTIVGVGINVMANYLLIPPFGREGAAVATVIGEVVSVGMLLRGLGWTLRRSA